MKRLLLSSVLSLIALVGICQTKKIDGIVYKVISTTEVEILDGKKAKGCIVIPENIIIKGQNYVVTNIQDYAFTFNENLTSLTLPSTVTSIGAGSFFGCDHLINVSMPDNMVRIGYSAFNKCSSLRSITIPNGITVIDVTTFCGCDNLKEIVIPTGVEEIGASAFLGCTELTKVSIPNGVVKIHGAAFADCKSLKSINLPNSITYIGFEAFANCSNLTDIVFPDRAEIAWNAFESSLGQVETIRGHNLKYPQWIMTRLLDYTRIENVELYRWARKIQRESYSYFAEDSILNCLEKWQQKKEYETTTQWQARVTEDSRKEYVKKIHQQLLDEFIVQKKPAALKGNIGSYDADYGVFPITTDGFGTFYLEVAMAEASQVKANWSKAKVLPTYGIADDKLAVASAEVKVNGKTYKTADRYEHTASDIAINLPPLQINLGGSDAVAPKPDVAQAIDRSIDQNIPVGVGGNDRTFAVIIGNENYKEVAKVPHALNDAKVFAAYCEKTLGLPQKNIKQYADATFGTMLSALENIQDIAEAYKGDINVIFYYAGHGIPNESSNEAYLLPVDANGRNTAACYPIDKLYGELKALNARQVTVFLDACFSGAQRGNGMLASARGVAIKAKQAAPQGNMVVFSAASADETAYPYDEKGHGLFTYYLLKKLNETKGNVTLGELGSYICEKVAQEAVVTNGKSQTPTVLSSVNIMDSWKELKLIKQ